MCLFARIRTITSRISFLGSKPLRPNLAMGLLLSWWSPAHSLLLAATCSRLTERLLRGRQGGYDQDSRNYQRVSASEDVPCRRANKPGWYCSVHYPVAPLLGIARTRVSEKLRSCEQMVGNLHPPVSVCPGLRQGRVYIEWGNLETWKEVKTCHSLF